MPYGHQMSNSTNLYLTNMQISLFAWQAWRNSVLCLLNSFFMVPIFNGDGYKGEKDLSIKVTTGFLKLLFSLSNLIKSHKY